VEGGRVVATGADAARLAAERVVELPGTLTPGLVDLQVNGGAGVSLQSPSPDMAALHRWLRAGGVLAYQPTLVSAPLSRMAGLAAVLGRIGELDGVLALRPHLEGPFISSRRLGAHDAAAVSACDVDALRAVALAHAGMVTLAPERQGGLELLRALAETGVVVSLGHSDAGFAEAEAAFGAGAGMVTHLFNAMPPLHHREPGLAGAALSGSHAPWVGLIADGVHVAPSMCLLAARLLGERMVLVSDAVAPAGTGAAESRLDGGHLAGSTLRLDGCVRNLIAWGVDDSAAVHAATLAPARVCGLPSRGALHPGFDAVAVQWDDSWSVRAAGPVESLARAGVGR